MGIETKGKYNDIGAKVDVSPRAAAQEDADWLFAMFSLVFPLDTTVPKDFFAASEAWTSGRFTGVEELTAQGSSLAKSYHQNQKSWLGATISARLASGRDLPANPGSGSGLGWSFHTAMDHLWDTPGVLAEYPGEPIDESSAYLQFLRHQHRAAGTRAEEFGWLRLDSKLHFNRYRAHWDGEFRLQAVEYLHFGDSHKLRTPDCLILHITGRNLTRDMLEDLSQALHRPRNHFLSDAFASSYIRGKASDRLAKGTQFEPLCEFITVINRLLTSSNGRKEAIFKAERSGALSSAEGSWSRMCSFVHRSVLAVPRQPDPRAPELLGAPEADDWSVFDGWSWSLAAGADIYFSGLPRLDDTGLGQQSLGDYQNWSVMAAENGIAAVRTNVNYQHDSKITMLASTRFVDLALLNIKAMCALLQLNVQLENDNNAGPEDENSHLRERLEHLQKAQMSLVEFRDHRWFNSIQKRDMGTKIMLGLRRSSGAQQMYEDFLDEIVLRERTYTTIFQVENAREQERREEARQSEADARESAQQDRESLNLLLAAGALLLALPALFIDLFGMPPGLKTSLIVFAVGTALFLVWMLWQRRKRKRRDKTAVDGG